jgi:hypothetical protein
MSYRRIAGAAASLMLANCAGSAGLPDSLDESDAQNAGMAGRWMLSAPNAPMCGMAVSQSSGAGSGNIVPEGGCPGNFYLSRRWTLEQGALSIKTDEDERLAQLTFTGAGFQGQSTAGTPISLTRPAIPTTR